VVTRDPQCRQDAHALETHSSWRRRAEVESITEMETRYDEDDEAWQPCG
jgi:hypothetical protein